MIADVNSEVEKDGNADDAPARQQRTMMAGRDSAERTRIFVLRRTQAVETVVSKTNAV
jgi:hypothetical protein